jgi:L-ascorbate metabolism protein UlaG (beta-lactamase superfamily)
MLLQNARNMHITWLGHATVLVEAGKNTIYIDPYFEPYGTPRLPKATLILVSHWHPDHCTRESIEMIRTDETTIIGTADVAREFFGAKTMRADEKIRVRELTIKALQAITRHHIGSHDEEGFVLGFLLECEGKKLYYTADTDPLPEMIGLMPDVVLIPVGGTTTMNPAEASKAVSAMQAKMAIPIHWGTRTGTRDDAELFKELTEQKGIPTTILQPGEMIDVV